MDDLSFRVLFVSWTPHNRATDIAGRLGGRAVTPAPWSRGLWWPLRFFVQGVATILAVTLHRPSHVIFTNPPFVAGMACLIGARLVGAQSWADCHSGAFNNPRWTRFASLNAAVLRRCQGTIFHNHPMGREHRQVSVRTVVVTTGGMRDRTQETRRTKSLCGGTGTALVVSSYEFDEPTDAVLDAARLIADVPVLFTGRAPESVRMRAPTNVSFSGFMPAAEYRRRLADAAVVVCLTTRENTMQNGATEALEHCRPIILSGTNALREWAKHIPGTVVLADHEPTTIAAAIRRVVDDPAEWDAAALRGQAAALQLAERELTTLRRAFRSGTPTR